MVPVISPPNLRSLRCKCGLNKEFLKADNTFCAHTHIAVMEYNFSGYRGWHREQRIARLPTVMLFSAVHLNTITTHMANLLTINAKTKQKLDPRATLEALVHKGSYLELTLSSHLFSDVKKWSINALPEVLKITKTQAQACGKILTTKPMLSEARSNEWISIADGMLMPLPQLKQLSREVYLLTLVQEITFERISVNSEIL
ncbi:hypothetical protein Tco_0639826 [Tanacetum coccineum]